MAFTIHLFYTGSNGAARQFAEEMESSGIAGLIREEDGNLGYDYYYPKNDPETVLLIDSWADEEALDFHHRSPMMKQIAELRDKYDLHMRVERFIQSEEDTENITFLRK